MFQKSVELKPNITLKTISIRGSWEMSQECCFFCNCGGVIHLSARRSRSSWRGRQQHGSTVMTNSSPFTLNLRIATLFSLSSPINSTLITAYRLWPCANQMLCLFSCRQTTRPQSLLQAGVCDMWHFSGIAMTSGNCFCLYITIPRDLETQNWREHTEVTATSHRFTQIWNRKTRCIINFLFVYLF